MQASAFVKGCALATKGNDLHASVREKASERYCEMGVRARRERKDLHASQKRAATT